MPDIFDLDVPLSTPPVTVRRGHTTPAHFNADLARRAAARRTPETSTDLSTLRLIPYAEVHRRLLELNPRMYFIDFGDGRIGLGVEHPSPGHIAAYEALSHYDRKEIDAHRQIPGPRVLLICISSNAIEPYTELVSAGGVRYVEDKLDHGEVGIRAERVPQRIICRSLTTVIRACVDGGAFAWEAAERKFGMPFEHAKTTVRYLPFTPEEFHNRTMSLVVSSL